MAHPAEMTAQAPRKAQSAKEQPRVVMQKVPFDPLAGKVYGHHAAPARQTAAAKSEKAQPQKLAAADPKADNQSKAEPSAHREPTLRTATDLY